jgi:phospholipid/cholesterol/gamma-HCH transport system ATP-binding protein
MIQLIDIYKRFGKQVVLDGVNFNVQEGETVALLGPSGTGKSVLLKHIIGLMEPDAGSIRVDDAEIVGLRERELNEVRKRFGMLFQGAALFDSLTVGENVGLPMREHQRLGDAEVRRRVAERLEWVGMSGVENMKPASLSGGMKKRVGLARALAIDPAFVLYDEPTTGLDPIMADVIDRLIRSMQKRLGVTSVVVTHDMTSAYKVADRMALLHDGRVVFLGTPEEVRTTSDPLVRQFVEGSSEGPIQPV